jgi:hypothetical protein
MSASLRAAGTLSPMSCIRSQDASQSLRPSALLCGQRESAKCKDTTKCTEDLSISPVTPRGLKATRRSSYQRVSQLVPWRSRPTCHSGHPWRSLKREIQNEWDEKKTYDFILSGVGGLGLGLMRFSSSSSVGWVVLLRGGMMRFWGSSGSSVGWVMLLRGGVLSGSGAHLERLDSSCRPDRIRVHRSRVLPTPENISTRVSVVSEVTHPYACA